MSEASRHLLVLELEVDGADEVSGRLTDTAGRGRNFVGWLGLAGAIEAFSDPRMSTESDVPHDHRRRL